MARIKKDNVKVFKRVLAGFGIGVMLMSASTPVPTNTTKGIGSPLANGGCRNYNYPGGVVSCCQGETGTWFCYLSA